MPEPEVAAAPAQVVCVSRDIVVADIADRYGEIPIGDGLSSIGIVELLVSEDDLTWTLIVTLPDGCVYLIGTGEAWQRVKHKLEGEKS